MLLGLESPEIRDCRDQKSLCRVPGLEFRSGIYKQIRCPNSLVPLLVNMVRDRQSCENRHHNSVLHLMVGSG